MMTTRGALSSSASSRPVTSSHFRTTSAHVHTTSAQPSSAKLVSARTSSAQLIEISSVSFNSGKGQDSARLGGGAAPDLGGLVWAGFASLVLLQISSNGAMIQAQSFEQLIQLRGDDSDPCLSMGTT